MNNGLANEEKGYYNYFQRGNARLVTKKYDGAIEDYDEVINRRSDYAPAYNFRGYAYREKGEFELALQDLNEAIRLRPDYVDAYINRGESFRHERRVCACPPRLE